MPSRPEPTGPEPLPDYDELPVDPAAPPGSAWGLWGPDDVLGSLNLAGPEQVRTAAAEIRRGAVFALGLPLDALEVPMFRRPAHRHVVHDTVFGHEDELHTWNPQTSSQWDGFRHVRHPGHGHWNGVDDEAHGVDHWARRGIVGRGVLADVARWRAAEGRPIVPNEPEPITGADVDGALAAQGTEVHPGDVLLIRTGYVGWYRSLDAAGRTEATGETLPSHCGLRPGRDTARWLWNLHVAAVAIDNPGFEVMPLGAWMPDGEFERALADPDAVAEYFLHVDVLALLGIPIGELFDLDALAEDCAGDGRYEFFFTSAPLPVTGGVATPPNALAIK